MSLNAGTKLGRYEIRSKIGAGGMGEVYLALDTDLDRTVAIKILPEGLASDQQRLRRFIQEAKAASALNVPIVMIKMPKAHTETIRSRERFMMLLSGPIVRGCVLKRRGSADRLMFFGFYLQDDSTRCGKDCHGQS